VFRYPISPTRAGYNLLSGDSLTHKFTHPSVAYHFNVWTELFLVQPSFYLGTITGGSLFCHK